MRRLFHFFIDGLGLGKDTEENPMRGCFSSLMGGLRFINQEGPVFFSGGVLIPVDAVQGVPGLPQSATGQTSLFTGVNAQELLGMHLTAFPNPPLMEIIEKKSLLKVLKEKNLSVTYANLYTREFLEERKTRKKNMLPVSALSIQAAGIPFRFPEEYFQGEAIFADITNRILSGRGFELPPISPEEGGRRVVKILENYQAVFFEYFLTDYYGHRRDVKVLEKCSREISRFAQTIHDAVSGQNDFLFLVCSDHGNAEDTVSADHTLNPAPLLLFSGDDKFLKKAAEGARRLTDVYDLAISWFDRP